MNQPKPSSINKVALFNRFSIGKKLTFAFGLVLTIFFMLVLFIQYKLTTQEALQNQIVELRFPTNIAGHDLVNGINHSLASLRGYMILGKDSFKHQRQEAWEEIDDSLNIMTKMSKSWSVPKNIEALKELKEVMAEFNLAQLKVEKISHTEDEQPAIKMLVNEAAPRAEKIVSVLNRIINEEKKQPATAERKVLLGLLADSRGSFSLASAFIRGFLINGDTKWLEKFDKLWKTNGLRLRSIQKKRYLLTETQLKLFKTYEDIRKEFSPLPPKMFEIRGSKKWNMANYLLGTEAAPLASKALKILANMVQNQNDLVATDVENLKRESTNIKTISVIATLIALIIGVLLSWVISRNILNRLAKVSSNLEVIATGDLTQNISIDGRDEIGYLQKSMLTMQNRLLDMISSIGSTSQQLSSTSEEVSVTMMQTANNIQNQQTETAQIANAMTEMSQAVGEVSDRVLETSNLANNANDEAVTGNKVVQDAVSGIQLLSKQINHASGVIDQVAQGAQEINTVLDVIKGIAEQTNLLALNAAIEAARAGEQGRGFAVVADEVRTLAGRTQDSTSEIHQIIERLQSGARDATQAMSESSEQSLVVVDKAELAGSSLNIITSSVDQIFEMSTQIAAAAEEQNVVAHNMSSSISQINDLAMQNAASIEQTSVAGQEIASNAVELQGLVEQFRLS